MAGTSGRFDAVLANAAKLCTPTVGCFLLGSMASPNRHGHIGPRTSGMPYKYSDVVRFPIGSVAAPVGLCLFMYYIASSC